jgi:protein-tyrosine phosphatase
MGHRTAVPPPAGEPIPALVPRGVAHPGGRRAGYGPRVDAVRPRRCRGALPGFANSADLGGLPLPGGLAVPSRRVLRANTPGQLDTDDLAVARAFGFDTVVDLRSREEVMASPHPLAQLPGYRWLPLIDPAAEAREDFSRYPTLGDIYSSSLHRNATHLAIVFSALATAPPGPVLVSCYAGRDRTGMIIALLLDLAGVERDVIEVDYSALRDQQRLDSGAIAQMLARVSDTYGSTAGYLRWLGLDDAAVDCVRERLRP